MRFLFLIPLLLSACSDFEATPFPNTNGEKQGKGLLTGEKGAYDMVLLKEKEEKPA